MTCLLVWCSIKVMRFCREQVEELLLFLTSYNDCSQAGVGLDRRPGHALVRAGPGFIVGIGTAAHEVESQGLDPLCSV
jgi:hypothetical protein